MNPDGVSFVGLHIIIMLARPVVVLVLQGWVVHRTPPKAAGSPQTLQKQRKTTAAPRQRRPSLLYLALIVLAIAGGVSAGWWWTVGDGRGVDGSSTNPSSESVSLLARQSAWYSA